MVLSLAFVFAMKSLKSVPRDETQAKPSFPSPSPLTYLMSAIDLLSKGNQVKGEHARPRGVRGLFQFPSLDTFTESENIPPGAFSADPSMTSWGLTANQWLLRSKECRLQRKNVGCWHICWPVFPLLLLLMDSCMWNKSEGAPGHSPISPQTHACDYSVITCCLCGECVLDLWLLYYSLFPLGRYCRVHSIMCLEVTQ